MEVRKCKNCSYEFRPSQVSLMREAGNPKGLSAKFCTIQCLNVYKTRNGIGNSGQFKKGQMTGDKNPGWLGDSIGYGGVHDWINAQFGKPKECENCHVNNDLSRKYQWANISGKYKRDISDWARLCHICHKLIDNSMRGLRKAQQRPVREMLSNNKSGFKNVFQDRRTGKFIPYIRSGKRKQKWLGRYDTAVEAYEVYKATAIDMYGVY